MAENTNWVNQFFQVVLVVNDRDETLEKWKQMVEFDMSSIRLGETGPEAKCVYRGQDISCPTRYATFDFGGVEIKLIEPLDKEAGNPYSDSLKKGGQGIHHIGFYTEQKAALEAYYAGLGVGPVYEENINGTHYQIYDFEAESGLKIVPWDHMEGPCAR